MHCPKLALRAGRFGRVFGVRMHIGQRKVVKSKPQTVAQTLLQVFDDWISLTAVRTFVIPVLKASQGHQGGPQYDLRSRPERLISMVVSFRLWNFSFRPFNSSEIDAVFCFATLRKRIKAVSVPPRASAVYFDVGRVGKPLRPARHRLWSDEVALHPRFGLRVRR